MILIVLFYVPVVVISCVGHLAERAIRLQQRVFSLHNIAITDLVLGLVVASVRVFHRVGVLVFGVSIVVLMSVAVVASMYFNGGSDDVGDGSSVNDGSMDDGRGVYQGRSVGVSGEGSCRIMRVVVHQVVLGGHRVSAKPEVTSAGHSHQSADS